MTYDHVLLISAFKMTFRMTFRMSFRMTLSFCQEESKAKRARRRRGWTRTMSMWVTALNPAILAESVSRLTCGRGCRAS